jgi:hypothetical protein
MKKILILLGVAGLLASTGCIFWRGHDHAEVRDHRQDRDQDGHPNGVDHGEHPGDMDHREIH